MTEQRRPGFWHSLFRRQPIEPGVVDPVDSDMAEVRQGFEEASQNMRAAMLNLLDDIEKRRLERVKNATPRS